MGRRLTGSWLLFVNVVSLQLNASRRHNYSPRALPLHRGPRGFCFFPTPPSWSGADFASTAHQTSAKKDFGLGAAAIMQA